MTKNEKKYKTLNKKLSKNEKRNRNEWKYNPVRWFKNEEVIRNDPVVELEISRIFNDKIDIYIREKKQECFDKQIPVNEASVLVNNLEKGHRKIVKFLNVINHYYRKGGSIRGLTTSFKIPKTVFYEIKRKYDVWKNSRFYSIKNFFPNSTRPKSIQYKYSDRQVKYICDYYFNYKYCDAKVNASIMQVTNELKFESNIEIYKNLSYTTTHKFIKRDERYKGVKKYLFAIKHTRRKCYTEPGNIQFDLKIVGVKETHFRRQLVFAIMKDESSKLTYGEYIGSGSSENAIRVLKNGLEYFREINLKIKRIRTDNAMMFKNRKNNVSNYKKINFINDNPFHQFLAENNIVHERIPLGESEANGTIERLNKTFDSEILMQIDKCETDEEIAQVFRTYIDWYNFQRYHTNLIHNDDPRIPLYIKPIDFLNELEKLIAANSLY